MKSPRKTGNPRHQKSPRRGGTSSRMMQQHGHGVVHSLSQSRRVDSRNPSGGSHSRSRSGRLPPLTTRTHNSPIPRQSPTHSRMRHSYNPYNKGATRVSSASLQSSLQVPTDSDDCPLVTQTKSRDFFCNRRARDYQARENCWSKYTSGGIGFKTLTFPKDASSKQVEQIIMENYQTLKYAGGFAFCDRKSRNSNLLVRSTLPPSLKELDRMFPQSHVIYLVPLQDDLPLFHPYATQVKCKRCGKFVFSYKLGKHLSLHDKGYDAFDSDVDSVLSSDDDKSSTEQNSGTHFEQSDSDRWSPNLTESSPLSEESRRAGDRRNDEENLPIPHELNQPRAEEGFGLLEPQPGPSSAADGQGFFTMNRRSSGSRQQCARSPDGNRVSQVRNEHRWSHRFESDDSRCGTGFNSRSERHHPGRKQSHLQSSIPEYEPQPGPSQGNPSYQRASSSSGARGKCSVNTKSRPSVTECEPQPGPSQGIPGFQRPSSSPVPREQCPVNTSSRHLMAEYETQPGPSQGFRGFQRTYVSSGLQEELLMNRDMGPESDSDTTS